MTTITLWTTVTQGYLILDDVEPMQFVFGEPFAKESGYQPKDSIPSERVYG